MPKQNDSEGSDQMPSWREVFLYFLFLGFVNIGGPVAQIAMSRRELVDEEHWVSHERFNWTRAAYRAPVQGSRRIDTMRE